MKIKYVALQYMGWALLTAHLFHTCGEVGGTPVVTTGLS